VTAGGMRPADAGHAPDGRRQPALAYVFAVNSSVTADLIPVLYQLLSGVVDTTACRQLNMSPRTFSRRVADVLDELGVTTRFQGGAECGRRAAMALAWKRNQEGLQAAAGSAGVAPRPPAQIIGWRWETPQIGPAADGTRAGYAGREGHRVGGERIVL
jgi:hypothetical protein